MSTQTISTDQIAALAHKFWEDEGRPDGRAESHWLRAIETLSIPATLPMKAKAAPKKPAKKP